MNKNKSKDKLEVPDFQTQKKNFIKEQNKCYLCGNDLNTHIEYLPKTHFVIERVQCRNCMTMVRVKNHSLQ